MRTLIGSQNSTELRCNTDRGFRDLLAGEVPCCGCTRRRSRGSGVCVCGFWMGLLCELNVLIGLLLGLCCTLPIGVDDDPQEVREAGLRG